MNINMIIIIIIIIIVVVVIIIIMRCIAVIAVGEDDVCWAAMTSPCRIDQGAELTDISCEA